MIFLIFRKLNHSRKVVLLKLALFLQFVTHKIQLSSITSEYGYEFTKFVVLCLGVDE